MQAGLNFTINPSRDEMTDNRSLGSQQLSIPPPVWNTSGSLQSMGTSSTNTALEKRINVENSPDSETDTQIAAPRTKVCPRFSYDVCNLL